MLRGGSSCAAAARASGLSFDSIERHKRSHVRQNIGSGVPATPLANIEELRRECDALADLAGARDDLRAQILVLGSKMRLLEVQNRTPQQQPTADGQWVKVGSVEFYDAVIRLHTELGLPRVGSIMPDTGTMA